MASAKTPAHVSVLLSEALNALDLRAGDIVVDATAGQGGHSEAILKTAGVRLIAIDADPQAVAAATARTKRYAARREVVEANFADIEKVLRKQRVREVTKVLFDLGWSSAQLSSGRGFSFQTNEPLLMSYGKKAASGFTAQEILNEWDEETIANVLYGYAQERYARKIAKAIVERRALQPITSTIELSELVRDAVPPAYRHGRVHPATKTFQALRIAVNDEMGVTERGIRAAWQHLACGGRLVVITFHSIEDRLVKQLFAELSKQDGRLLFKKPQSPSREEIIHNPRARSAKLRAIEKVCKPTR